MCVLKEDKYLHVETVMLAGTLILLLMTANKLMLYSMPASRPEIMQVVVLPGILISNWTPDRSMSIRAHRHITALLFKEVNCSKLLSSTEACFNTLLLKTVLADSLLTSSTAWCISH